MLAIKEEPEDYPNWEGNSGRIFPEGHGAISGYTDSFHHVAMLPIKEEPEDCTLQENSCNGRTIFPAGRHETTVEVAGGSALSVSKSISSLAEGCENQVKREEVNSASSQESGNCVMEAKELASSCLKGGLLKRIKKAETNDVLFEESEDSNVINLQAIVKVEEDDIAVVIKMEDSDPRDEGCGESSILQQNSHQLEGCGESSILQQKSHQLEAPVSYEIYLAGMSSDINTNVCVAPSEVVEDEDSCAHLKNSQRFEVPASERQNSSVCEEEIQGEYELLAHDMESPSHSSQNPDSKNDLLECTCIYEKSSKCEFCNKSFSPDVRCNIDQMILNEREPREILKGIHKYRKCINVTFVKNYSKKKVHRKVHEKVHRVVKRFPCRFCEKLFVKNSRLRMHEMIHTGEKPFECKFCEKSFRTKLYRGRHERIHTGERPFKCRFCKRLFSQSHHCRQHEMIHTGERPFKCQFCEKSYTRQGHRKEHEKIHTGEKSFRCSYCEKSFVIKKRCKSHERTHTGERPFKCQFCEKSFTRRSDCNRHEMIHTGEK